MAEFGDDVNASAEASGDRPKTRRGRPGAHRSAPEAPPLSEISPNPSGTTFYESGERITADEPVDDDGQVGGEGEALSPLRISDMQGDLINRMEPLRSPVSEEEEDASPDHMGRHGYELDESTADPGPPSPEDSISLSSTSDGGRVRSRASRSGGRRSGAAPEVEDLYQTPDFSPPDQSPHPRPTSPFPPGGFGPWMGPTPSPELPFGVPQGYASYVPHCTSFSANYPWANAWSGSWYTPYSESQYSPFAYNTSPASFLNFNSFRNFYNFFLPSYLRIEAPIGPYPSPTMGRSSALRPREPSTSLSPRTLPARPAVPRQLAPPCCSPPSSSWGGPSSCPACTGTSSPYYGPYGNWPSYYTSTYSTPDPALSYWPMAPTTTYSPFSFPSSSYFPPSPFLSKSSYMFL
eukprot:NODE_1475_length_1405_cov_8.533923_g1224_i0.p1 GENE.NODE_1475_length_1405_cov_8.533923_g1224_i0~~NODE_1475_length_1405_cov_8.533923_g1224_i0.p1  ORF type:complete len:406 (-),score=15.26 NODE_1475_length_1405_cov_8.533923_g1224_i0:113-1330(-)